MSTLSPLEQLRGEVRSDEAAATGDEHPHRGSAHRGNRLAVGARRSSVVRGEFELPLEGDHSSSAWSSVHVGRHPSSSSSAVVSGRRWPSSSKPSSYACS